MEQAAVHAPRAEPAAVPPEKGWARLVRAIPFFRPKQAAPPPDVAEAIVLPPAATPATVEAGLLPATESAPAEEEQTAAAGIGREQEMPATGRPPEPQEWPVEAAMPMPAPGQGEMTPAAEPAPPAPAQEQWVPEAGPLLQPSSGEEPATPPQAEGRRQSEVVPQTEEGGPPGVEVASEEAPARRRALKLKASPPPEVKEVWAPPVEAGPAPAEDWWAAEETSATRPVLKLKASPPAEKEPKQSPVEAGAPPPAEDWWTAEAETDAEAPAEKRQVLKLKASPPPEREAEQTPDEGEPPPAEDWWTP
jgi:hypothetical protein